MKKLTNKKEMIGFSQLQYYKTFWKLKKKKKKKIRRKMDS